MARRKSWSYKTGECARNRVRVFEKAPGSNRFYLEWKEDDHKKRVLLRNVDSRRVAKQKADKLAAEFSKLERTSQAPMTMTQLIISYNREVSPTKGSSKQGHDRRAARVWRAFFGSQAEVSRQGDRHPSSLDRLDWDRFISARRKGRIRGWPKPVRDRSVGYDLAYMCAVLTWACGQKRDGKPMVEASPWRAEVRRAQNWEIPKEKNPHRPSMTDEIRNGLISHAPSWQFGLALAIQRETARRNSSVRQLRWKDLNLEVGEIRWREDSDKVGKENVTPISEELTEKLRKAPSRGIGKAPVFPSAHDPVQPTPRNTFQIWLRRSKDRWLKSLPEDEREELRSKLQGVGFHAEKRSAVRDPSFRSLPPAIQEAISGTSFETLRTIYDEVTVDDIRKAISNQRAVLGS